MVAGTEIHGLGRGKTIISAAVTGAASSLLAGVTASISASASGSLYGLIAPATGAYADRTCFQVWDCDIAVANTGAGAAYGFTTEAGGELYMEQVRIRATSTGGSGYAGVYVASFWHKQGTASGSTGRYQKGY
jgi:hypothetical protein